MPATNDQPLRALERAHWVRSARAKLRQAIKASKVDGYAVLAGEDATWETIAREVKAKPMLRMLKGVGPATATDLLARLQIEEEIKLKALTFERRAQMADLLHEAMEGTKRG